MIMSDQHAPGWLGGMAHPRLRTPNLDRLRRAGVCFDNAYCSYPMCTPSRAGFMTGHLTPEHGVWELGSPLHSDLPTWPHVLRQAGYTTSIAGRMHFVGPDRHHGFQRRVHQELHDEKLLTPFTYGHWSEPQADDHVMVDAVRNAGPVDAPNYLEQYDDGVTESALTELRHLSTLKSPWALTVGYILPHFPYAIHQPWFDLYEDEDVTMPRPPPDGSSWEELVPPQLRDNRKWLGLTSDGVSAEEVRRARRAYYGMITCLDAMIGRLIDELTALGVAENTWIVYTSDHGDNMGEHGFWSKLNFFEESVRVPLIIAPPACPHAGAHCLAPVSSIDWMPTMLALTDQQDAFDDLPGKSLLPLLDDPSSSWPERAIIADYACGGTRVTMRMVRRNRWKASFAPGFPPTLYDLQADPHEEVNLGESDVHQDILAELAALAHADGWDGEALTAQVGRHKRRLTYINKAENRAT